MCGWAEIHRKLGRKVGQKVSKKESNEVRIKGVGKQNGRKLGS
jgi:hypothetical protein